MAAKSIVLAALILAGGLTTGSVSAQGPAGAAVEAEIATVPVELDGAVLFRVRGASSFPAGVRARRIRETLEAVAGDPAISVDALRIVEREGVAQIVAGDQLLMVLVEADARLEQVRLVELATIHLARMRQAITAYRAARSPAALQRAVVRALVATLMCALAIAVVLRLWHRAHHVLMHRLQPHIHAIGLQSFTLMRAEQIAATLRSGIGALRAVVLLAIALVYLGFMLAQFPATRGLSGNLVALLLRPLQVIGSGIIESVPGLIFLAVLFYVVRLSLKLIRLFFDAVNRGSVTLTGFDREWAQPTYKIIRVAAIAFALIVAYPYIPGSGSDAFKGISLFLGVILSLGSTSAISNIIAGYMMTYRRAFKVGDRVKIGNSVGDVVEMRLQVTHLRSYKNEELIIPNSQILTSEVLNYSSIARTRGLILHTEVGIGYDTPWRQVEAMLIMAAEQTPGLLAEPRPFVWLKKLGDFAVTYELNAYCHCRDVKAMGHLYTELHRHILDVFNEYGVQIMTPTYEGDPFEPKIVARQNWHAAPAPVRAEPDSRPEPVRRSS
ncbi:MAG: mechanosensitive ion channel family protein [Vicinamibacterales bacterium]